MHDDELDEATVRHLLDPDAPAAAGVTRLEALLRPLGDEPARPLRRPAVRARVPRPLAVAALLLVGLGLFAWQRLASTPVIPPARGGWAFTRTTHEGVEHGRLAVGGWLVTGAGDVAEVIVPSLGTLDVGPRTRLRLVGDRRDERRVELAEGRIEAVVTAPPRLFVVDTPSAAAVDMGCAYELEVDAAGNGWLVVTAGWVALESQRGAVHVPAGARCRLRAGHGPGLPFFEEAPEAVRLAVAAVEQGEGTGPALERLLQASADLDDALVLAHALPHAEGALRERLLDRAAELAPLPEGTTRAQLLALDAGALERWFDAALR